MTYASLTQVHEELNLASSITTNDAELNDLLTAIDTYVNTRLQRSTSLPLNTELQTPLGDIEARWVVARFRLRRATPQEQQQYQTILNEIEQEFQSFLNNNFKTAFTNIGSRSGRTSQDNMGRGELDRW